MDGHGNSGTGSMNSPDNHNAEEQIRSLKDLDQALGQVLENMDQAMEETDRAVDAAEELLRT
jgi:hypothetical protein